MGSVELCGCHLAGFAKEKDSARLGIVSQVDYESASEEVRLEFDDQIQKNGESQT